MVIMTNKQYEREIEKIREDERRIQRMWSDMDMLHRELYELKQKVEAEHDSKSYGNVPIR